MKTKKDILKILKEKYGWCEREVKKAIEHVNKFSNDATLEEISKGIPSMWAYYWGFYVGDRNIMMKRVTDPEWAYYWALDIGDRNIMMKRITNPKWAYLWIKNIGNEEIMRKRMSKSEWSYWQKIYGKIQTKRR